MNNNTELNVYREKLKLAQKQIDVVKATNYPTVELQADYRTFNAITFPSLEETWREGYTINLNLNFVLYDGNQKKSKVIQSKIDKLKEDLSYKDKVQDIKTQYQQILEDLKSLKLKIEALKTNLKAAEEALKLSTERYKFGLTDVIELLDTKRNYDQAYINYLLSVYNYNQRVIDLFILSGIR